MERPSFGSDTGRRPSGFRETLLQGPGAPEVYRRGSPPKASGLIEMLGL